MPFCCTGKQDKTHSSKLEIQQGQANLLQARLSHTFVFLTHFVILVYILCTTTVSCRRNIARICLILAKKISIISITGMPQMLKVIYKVAKVRVLVVFHLFRTLTPCTNTSQDFSLS